MQKNSFNAVNKTKTTGEHVDVGGLLDFLRLPYTDIQRLLPESIPAIQTVFRCPSITKVAITGH